MPNLSPSEDVLEAIRKIVDPHTGLDFVSTRKISNLVIKPNLVSFELEMTYPAQSLHGKLKSDFKNALQALAPNTQATITIRTNITAHAAQRGVPLLPGVKNIVAVASGKGGVGKSTTAVNLALALAAEGAQVGLLDADIYGPSQPMMMGITGKPPSDDGKTMQPMVNHGVKVMSIGFLIEPDNPMIWRGPMATQALDQLLRQTQWGELDYLIVDMPPGTGDIQLTLSQRVPLTGAVIVTTPQDIALLDAKKGIRMFEKVGVPILGIVENMSVYICPQCGHSEAIFGHGGGAQLAYDYHSELLGSLPLDLQIRLQADSGQPTVVADPQSKAAQLYFDIARRMAARIAQRAPDYSAKFPKITISPNT
jgi:ATP-binding protein involved in chromosome partitioning